MKAEPTEEIILLQRLAQNDRQAAESIYKQHFNMIQSLIINNNGSFDDARDIFQEAVIVLYEKARSGTFELNCQLKTYLYSVCRRLWLKRLQQQQQYEKSHGINENTPPASAGSVPAPASSGAAPASASSSNLQPAAGS